MPEFRHMAVAMPMELGIDDIVESDQSPRSHKPFVIFPVRLDSFVGVISVDEEEVQLAPPTVQKVIDCLASSLLMRISDDDLDIGGPAFELIVSLGERRGVPKLSASGISTGEIKRYFDPAHLCQPAAEIERSPGLRADLHNVLWLMLLKKLYQLGDFFGDLDGAEIEGFLDQCFSLCCRSASTLPAHSPNVMATPIGQATLVRIRSGTLSCTCLMLSCCVTLVNVSSTPNVYTHSATNFMSGFSGLALGFRFENLLSLRVRYPNTFATVEEHELRWIR